MKKYLLILVFFPAVISTKAQNVNTLKDETSFPGSSHLSEMLHFHAGVTLSKFTGNNQSNSSFLPGFAFGAVIKIPICVHTYLVPGIGFSTLGSKYTGYDDKYHLGYGDASLDGEYDICEPDMYFQTGARARFLTSAKYKNQGTSTDVKNSFKKVDVGLDAGVGYRITPQFHIFIITTIGITNIVVGNGTTHNLDFEAGARVNF
jgi:Outer membrane protein beta-barrel domain